MCNCPFPINFLRFFNAHFKTNFGKKQNKVKVYFVVILDDHIELKMHTKCFGENMPRLRLVTILKLIIS